MSGVRRKRSILAVGLVVLVVFFVLFLYSSLNLKNIDYGYRLQELTTLEKKLQEEIDRLSAERAQLLNLERVERIATRELGFQYPQPGQVISLTEKRSENQ